MTTHTLKETSQSHALPRITYSTFTRQRFFWSSRAARAVLAFTLATAGAAAQSHGDTGSPYSFIDEVFVGGNYTRGFAGPGLAGSNFGGWNVSGTRYFSPLLGFALDAQGMYGHAPLNEPLSSFSDPQVRKHTFMAGPQIRWRRRARWSASIRLMAGVVNTSTGSLPTGQSAPALGLYENATKFAFRPGSTFDFHLSPRVSMRMSNGPIFERQNGGFKGQFSTSVGLVFRMGHHPERNHSLPAAPSQSGQ